MSNPHGSHASVSHPLRSQPLGSQLSVSRPLAGHTAMSQSQGSQPSSSETPPISGLRLRDTSSDPPIPSTHTSDIHASDGDADDDEEVHYDQFIPSNITTRIITKATRKLYDGPYASWSDFPFALKEQIFNDFKGRFTAEVEEFIRSQPPSESGDPIQPSDEDAERIWMQAAGGSKMGEASGSFPIPRSRDSSPEARLPRAHSSHPPRDCSSHPRQVHPSGYRLGEGSSDGDDNDGYHASDDYKRKPDYDKGYNDDKTVADAGDRIAEMSEKTKKNMKESMEKTVKKINEAKKKSKSTSANSMKDKASELAQETKDKVKNKAHDRKQKIKDTTQPIEVIHIHLR
uniref:Uncharacterized protein LOC104219025 n=1 Tax=Nicotiana sylvestris TaxID=4096 RepID=A0A1U7VNJ0_NICSY|nr:PREDICTED: uncharacterized protein LOC104219025 [Nicotiana sylvestris]